MFGSRSLLPPFPPDVVTSDPQNPIISVILNPESGYTQVSRGVRSGGRNESTCRFDHLRPQDTRPGTG
jgi:hypothetical protein